jgi:hypothetical protein
LAATGIIELVSDAKESGLGRRWLQGAIRTPISSVFLSPKPERIDPRIIVLIQVVTCLQIRTTAPITANTYAHCVYTNVTIVSRSSNAFET